MGTPDHVGRAGRAGLDRGVARETSSRGSGWRRCISRPQARPAGSQSFADGDCRQGGSHAVSADVERSKGGDAAHGHRTGRARIAAAAVRSVSRFRETRQRVSECAPKAGRVARWRRARDFAQRSLASVQLHMSRSRRLPRREATEAELVLGAEDASLLDIVDNVLNKGVVLSGDLTIALANVDLIYVRLSVLLCAADRVLPPL